MKEKLEHELHSAKVESTKAFGDHSTSSATVNRLQTQLNGAKNELELMLRQKEELERIIKS